MYSFSLSDAHCSERGVKITSVKRKKTLQVFILHGSFFYLYNLFLALWFGLVDSWRPLQV